MNENLTRNDECQGYKIFAKFGSVSVIKLKNLIRSICTLTSFRRARMGTWSRLAGASATRQTVPEDEHVAVERHLARIDQIEVPPELVDPDIAR